MERKTIIETIFKKQNDRHPIPFKDITIEFQPNDIIIAGYDKGFYSEDNSWDPHYYLEVQRDRLENDAEYEKRMESEAHQKEYSKKRRYESYLKLKKEFKNKNK